MIIIIDYGMGNVGSIKNMLNKIGAKSIITSEKDAIENADKIILPGVGSFDNGIDNLKQRGLDIILGKKVITDKVPILGICLGMQLMTNSSEEGKLKGLGWIIGETYRFNFDDKGIKIPHMGWNKISLRKQSKLFNELREDARFYFVHSYYVKVNNLEDTLTTTYYGFDFTSTIERANIFGVQFHPEKSHKYGMKLLKNFTEL